MYTVQDVLRDHRRESLGKPDSVLLMLYTLYSVLSEETVVKLCTSAHIVYTVQCTERGSCGKPGCVLLLMLC